MENTTDNRFNFLDTTLIITNNELNLEHFRKPSAMDCMTNYKTAFSPKNYKIGAFIGELYRCHHATTTDAARDRAIEKSKNIYLKNHYPLNLPNQKIKEVLDRNFKNRNFLKNRKKTLKTRILKITHSPSPTLVYDAHMWQQINMKYCANSPLIINWRYCFQLSNLIMLSIHV
jgi:hypothetical protein